LRGRISGLAWPTYVLEAPDGGGKAPLGPTFADATPAGWRVTPPLRVALSPRDGAAAAAARPPDDGAVGGLAAAPPAARQPPCT